MREEFEQRYDATSDEPVRVWLFCRLCRCRMQVRCVPRPALAFRCFCGQSGTFSSFDVFSDEEEVRRFVATYEDIYQTTKNLLREAEMPMPATRIYRADEIKRLKRGMEGRVLDSSEEEALPGARRRESDGRESDGRESDGRESDGRESDGREAGDGFRAEADRLSAQVQGARTALERHDALCELARLAYAQRASSAEARRLAYEACGEDVKIAREVLREATARYKAGEKVALKFPTFKRLVLLLVEDKDHARALEVASRAVQLGLPGYDEKVEKLRKHLRTTGESHGESHA